jgi:hypothetical protein
MLLRVALVKNEVSEERIFSILRMRRIGERIDVFTAVTIKNGVFWESSSELPFLQEQNGVKSL